MPLNKPSGNMYPWAYTWNPLAGECEHRCNYCYVTHKIAPFLSRGGNDKYYGKPRLIEKEFSTQLIVPDGFLIFVQSCGDLFGSWISKNYIERVLRYIQGFPDTDFLLQTKNPHRFNELDMIPRNCILGTTIETDRWIFQTEAPQPCERFIALRDRYFKRREVMVSIEPIMNFSLDTLSMWMNVLRPKFVSIGADSGNNKLLEPPSWKLKKLVWELKQFTEVKQKKNLKRLLNA